MMFGVINGPFSPSRVYDKRNNTKPLRNQKHYCQPYIKETTQRKQKLQPQQQLQQQNQQQRQ